MSNQSLAAWRRIDDLMKNLRNQYDDLEASINTAKKVDVMIEADCAAEEAAYQAAIDTSMTAHGVLAAAQQVADAADVVASIACQELVNCQMGG